MTPSDSDSVAIFIVGWKCTGESICSQPVSLEGPPFSVSFKADDLPRDSTEFYQFCYIGAEDQRVRGISSPFQVGSDDLVTIDWELVEGSQTAAEAAISNLSMVDGRTEMEDKSLQAEEPSIVVIDMATQATDESESLKANFETQIKELNDELQTSKQELVSMTEQKEKLGSEFTASQDALQVAFENLKQQFLESRTANEQLEFALKNKEAEAKLLLEKLTDVEGQLADERIKSGTSESVEDLKRQKDEANAKIAELMESLNIKEEALKNSETELREIKDQLEIEKMKRGSDTIRLSDIAGRNSQADSSLTKVGTCPICQMEFLPEDPVQVKEAHVLAHLERICPVCEKKFSPDCEESFLIKHVDHCLAEHNK
jgi:polyhydroxyalkanoate synthesis regulator phasin